MSVTRAKPTQPETQTPALATYKSIQGLSPAQLSLSLHSSSGKQQPATGLGPCYDSSFTAGNPLALRRWPLQPEKGRPVHGAAPEGRAGAQACVCGLGPAPRNPLSSYHGSRLMSHPRPRPHSPSLVAAIMGSKCRTGVCALLKAFSTKPAGCACL